MPNPRYAPFKKERVYRQFICISDEQRLEHILLDVHSVTPEQMAAIEGKMENRDLQDFASLALPQVLEGGEVDCDGQWCPMQEAENTGVPFQLQGKTVLTYNSLCF